MIHETYKYIPADSIYAQIEEELSSYFDTGAVSNILFPKYTQYLLSQFNKTYQRKVEIPLQVNNGIAILPEDFISMKEVYLCTTVNFLVPLPGATYYQKDCRITSRVRHRCDECFNMPEPCNTCNHCRNKDYMVTHKITNMGYVSYSISGELLPDVFTRKYKCSTDCNTPEVNAGYYAISEDGCRIQVPFDDGILHIVYYSSSIEEDGIIMIPDRPNFKDYLTKYLKFKVFEMLFNSTTDETFNQIAQKYQIYKRDMEEAYVDAEIESKRRNKIDVVKGIIRQRNRFNKYKIR